MNKPGRHHYENLRSTALAAIVAFAAACSKEQPKTASPDVPTSRLPEGQSDVRFQLYNETWDDRPTPASADQAPTPPDSSNKTKVEDKAGDGKAVDGKPVTGTTNEGEIVIPGHQIKASLSEMPKELRRQIIYGRETAEQLLALANCVIGDHPEADLHFSTDNRIVEISVAASRWTRGQEEAPRTELGFRVVPSKNWTGKISDMPMQPIVSIATQACLEQKGEKK